MYLYHQLATHLDRQVQKADLVRTTMSWWGSGKWGWACMPDISLSFYPLRLLRWLTTSNVLNSTRPTAAIRLFPLTVKYPITKSETPDSTINAVCQLRTLQQIRIEERMKDNIPISPNEPCWPALGIWQSEPIPTPASDLAAMTLGSSAKLVDVCLSALSLSLSLFHHLPLPRSCGEVEEEGKKTYNIVILKEGRVGWE